MSDKKELLEAKRNLNEDEIEELIKVSKRREYAGDTGFSYEDFEVAFFRQGNFTLSILHIPDLYPIAGVSKKHPEYDPKYNEEVGKKLSLIRAWENFMKITAE